VFRWRLVLEIRYQATEGTQSQFTLRSATGSKAIRMTVGPMSLAVDIPPAIGEIVRVRSRRYLVEVSAPPTFGDDTLVRLLA
jgi:hypothetical protein